MRVVLGRTLSGDRRFDNLSGSHHQSQVNCVSSVYGFYVSGHWLINSNRCLSRDVIGCFKFVPLVFSVGSLGRVVVGCED